MASRPRRPYTPRMPMQERREQLLDAALAVIARDGYGGVSIEAIAREADVTRPVVYGAFDGLGSLLYALLDRQEKRALRQLAIALPLDLSPDDPDAALVAAVGDLYDLIARDPMTWRPILLAPEGTPPPVRERIDRDRDLVRRRLQALLEQKLKTDEGVDPEIVAHALLAVGEHFGRQILDQPDRVDRERLIGTVRGLLAALR
ncbi:MAG TPA: TetR/AcrR family transcriptional regulator [Solirubrobacteraceae bacterium]|nr:TetR/AcrR family transcriptional regulator [Solirubrobacteraceae bacterium]